MRHVATMLAVLFTAAPAQASTLSTRVANEGSEDSRGNSLSYVLLTLVATDAAEHITAGVEDGHYVIRDPRGITGEPAHCTRPDATTARCSRAVTGLDVRLGGGDDVLRYEGLYETSILAGEGDDRIEGSGGTISGGPDDDALIGGRREETMDGGPGADLLDPGPGGSDRLSYAERTGGVSIDVRGDAAAGEPGEGDTVKPGFRYVVTGAGPDLVIAAPGGTSIDSRDGDDVLEGGPGHDTLETGDGADVARGGAGDDEIFGDDLLKEPAPGDTLDAGPGADYVYGSGGPDTITGGPGPDHLVGGGGADRMLARDGEADDVECHERFEAPRSPGRDAAVLDSDDVAGWCGRVSRTGSPRAELLFAGEPRAVHAARGVVRAHVTCRGRRPCRGRLTVRAGSETSGRVRFRLAGGRRRVIRVPFRLGGRGGASRKASLRLVLITRDAAGRTRRVDLDFQRRGR